MLVLSRKLGEPILVSHCDLAVTVVAIEGKTVRLGIAAPAEVGVYREELWRQVCEQPSRGEYLRPGPVECPHRGAAPPR